MMKPFDMTPYLVLACNHALDFFQRYDAGFALETPNPLSGVLAMKTRLYATHLKFFGAFKRFDIKRKMESINRGAVVLGGKGLARWVDYSAPGNILFGYISAARGLNRQVCWAAGGLLESLDLGRFQPQYREFWYDHPGDKAAVDFGWDLYLTWPDVLTLEQLRHALTGAVLEQFQPPPLVPDEPPVVYDGDLLAYPYSLDAFLNPDADMD
jgi:hypothetical protein